MDGDLHIYIQINKMFVTIASAMGAMRITLMNKGHFILYWL